MAEGTTTQSSSKKGDFGQSQVQSAFDEAQKKGYFGTKVDPLPNSDHSLESGPEAPTVAEMRRDIDIAELEEEKAK